MGRIWSGAPLRLREWGGGRAGGGKRRETSHVARTSARARLSYSVSRDERRAATAAWRASDTPAALAEPAAIVASA